MIWIGRESSHFISDPLKANDCKIGDFLSHVPGLEKIEWLLADAEDYPIRFTIVRQVTGQCPGRLDPALVPVERRTVT